MNKYLEKIAKEETKPKRFIPRKHHKEALKKLEQEGGLVVDHSTGSGKTSLYAQAIANAQAKNPGGKALVIAPASLTDNLQNQAEKLGIPVDMSKVEAMSYEKAVREAKNLKKNKYLITIADEGHRLRNFETKTHTELEDVIKGSKQRVIGTGTTTYNHARDIAPLVNLAAGKDVLPEGRAFDTEHVGKTEEHLPILKRILGAKPREKQTLRNTAKLSKQLNKYVHYYNAEEDPSMKDKFPTKTEKVIEVPMDGKQEAIYKYLEGQLPWHLKMKVRADLPLDKRESAQLNAYSSGVRQVSNSVKPFMANYEHVSPKILAMVDNLEKKHKSDKNFRGIVYSNYLEGGLRDYSAELTKRNIPHKVFVGSMSKAQKDEAKNAYNEGKAPVLLISSSGSEGLDMKGTKLIQIMEPHFNDSKIKQVMGRGARFESHEHLPEKERKVEVERYHSTFKPGLFGKSKSHSIDQYLHHNSKTKDDLSGQLKDLLKQKS